MNTVTSTRILSTDAATAWAKLGDVTAVVHWHPAVEKADLLSPSPTGVGASRRCHFYDGSTVVEEVVAADETRRVRMKLSEFSVPMKTFEVEFRLSPIDGSSCQATVEMAYEMKFGVLGSLMNALMVKGQMSKVGARMLAGLEHHLVTGEEVGKDFKAA